MTSTRMPLSEAWALYRDYLSQFRPAIFEEISEAVRRFFHRWTRRLLKPKTKRRRPSHHRTALASA